MEDRSLVKLVVVSYVLGFVALGFVIGMVVSVAVGSSYLAATFVGFFGVVAILTATGLSKRL